MLQGLLLRHAAIRRQCQGIYVSVLARNRTGSVTVKVLTKGQSGAITTCGTAAAGKTIGR